MAISYDQIYFVEKQRNNKYEWLMFVVAILVLIGHGIFFHWLPGFLRSRRSASLKFSPYFKFLSLWDRATGCCCLNTRWGKWYFQPSILLLGVCYIGLAVAFCFLETEDIDYEPHYYIIGKRIGRVAVGNLIPLFLCIMKSDLVAAVSGLQHDRVTFLHKWLGRLMWVLLTAHMIICLYYWLSMNFLIMIEIPPQIFGMISYACMFFLTWGSLRFIRSWAFDFFLAQHRVFNFIMLLLAFFHNHANRAVVLIAVHSLVVDKIVGRVITFIHKRFSPTRGMSDFEILDDDTLLVTYPMKVTEQPWWTTFLPKVYTWKPGQHVYLNVWKVSKFQYHPFTISSLPESGNIVLVIRKQNGFTKKLFKKLQQIKEEDPEGTLQLKASIAGPAGGKHQPLISFDTSLFLSAGAGASYTLPLVLDLVQEIKHRNSIEDFLHRPQNVSIRFVWVVRKKSNILWYKHILRELLPYIKDGTIAFEVYVTQESSEQIDNGNSSIENTSSDGLMDGLDSSCKKSESIDVFDKWTSEESSVSLLDDCSIQFSYRRPDLAYIIEEEALKLTDKELKALSVSSCGPQLFVNLIKHECIKNKRPRYAPDIYCHSEVF